MPLVRKLIHFLRYLIRKKSELKRINQNDALLAKVVVDIHRKRQGSDFRMVPLHSIRPIHPIDRGEALRSKEKRIRIVEAVKAEVLAAKTVSREFLEKYLPSVSSIKIVEMDDGTFVSYEGNGRLGAIQEVFKGERDIRIEVELYRFSEKDRIKVRRRINRVRKWNGISRGDESAAIPT